ncbi:MAG: CPBP family intramembrane metalloprotease [Acidimicrobiia bacterium]|nr:CPBP family intramembrane metalloprotease [Acidimicrobiia bacterium]
MGLGRFWGRVIDVRSVPGKWWVITAVGAGGPAVVVWAVAGAREFEPSGITAVLGIAAFALAASFAEEPGWRGYALDKLRQRRLLASVVIAAAWAGWHLPLYAIEGTFQHDEVGFATTLFCIFMAALLPQTILMVWVLDHTRPSILPAVVFHALTNISGELLTLTTTQQAVRLAVWAVLAAPVVVRWLRKAPSEDGVRAAEPPPIEP